MTMQDCQTLAEAVRTACFDAAREAYEDAGMRGLCHEGRWEIALDAIMHVDIDALIRRSHGGPSPGRRGVS